MRMMLLASAYSLAAETAVLVAGPTIIFAPFSCNLFIATRLPSGLDFESAINKVKRGDDDDEELMSSKCLFTSYSAFSNATLIGLPIEEKEPVNGIIAPTTNSFLPSSLYFDKSGALEVFFMNKLLLSSPLKTFVKYKPENIRRDINVMEVKRTFLEVPFLIFL